jgi:hypothetical protein
VPKRDSKQEERRTAIHEAAHAVLGDRLGIGLRYVCVTTDDDSVGHARFNMEQGDDADTLLLFAEDAFLLRRAIVWTAGGAAVRQAGERNWMRGAVDDHYEAEECLRSITDDQESLDIYRALAKRRTSVLVEHYWPEIEAVADALLRAGLGRLSGKRVREIVSRSLAKGKRAVLSW